MNKLTEKEKQVLNEFKRKLWKSFPDDIVEIKLFGSKARGDANPDSDIDILVVTASDDWRKGDAIRGIGYELDDIIDSKLSIQVLSVSHIHYLRSNDFQFIRNIEREGVAV